MAAPSELNSPLQLQLPRDPTGAPPSVSPYLEDLYSAFYQLQLGLVQYCGIAQQPYQDWPNVTPVDTILQSNMNRLYLYAFETLGYGDLVNVYAIGAQIAGRKADATNNTKPCWAICSTEDGIPAGEFGEVTLMQGLSQNHSGLTLGSRYYLSTTPGALTTTAPVAAGNIEQFVGLALSDTLLYFNSGTWIQH